MHYNSISNRTVFVARRRSNAGSVGLPCRSVAIAF
jgi:hypothetical protein